MKLKKLRIQLKAKMNRELSTEEIGFLLANGNDFVLKRYLRFNSLPEQHHLALLKRSEDVVKTYIRYRSLTQEAEMELLAKPSSSLLEYYLHFHCPSLALQAELLKPENEDALKEFIQNNPFDNDELVIKFIKDAPDDAVIEYVKSYALPLEAFCELLDRSSLLAQTHAEEFYLDQESEVKFLLKATPDQVAKYIEESLDYGLHPMGEIVLLNSGNVELIKRYIQHFHLGDKDEDIENPQEMLLLHLGNKELLLAYVAQHKACEKFVVELLRSGDKDVAAALLSSQQIPWQAENILLDMGREYVERYIAHSGLGKDAEKRLVKTYPAEVLKPYIEKFWLSDEAEAELVRQGDIELIKFYIDNNHFCLEAQKLLIKTLNKELIAYYDKRQGFADEAWKEIAYAFFMNNL